MNSFPPIGSMWMHDRFGLVMFLGTEPYENPQPPQSWERLYTIYVLLVSENRRSSGIFAHEDWHEQFTPL